MRAGALIGVAAAFALAGSALAQAPGDVTRWTSINAAFPPPSVEEATAAVVAAEAECPASGATLGPIASATGWRRIDDAIRAGQLVNGWSVTATRPQCPPERSAGRYVLLRDSSGALVAQLLHDGRSYLDLDTLLDTALPRAMRTVAMAASRDIPGCSPNPVGLLWTEIVDETKLGPEQFGLRQGSWRELWTFTACGRVLTVFVDVEGGPDGTRATVGSWASLRR